MKSLTYFLQKKREIGKTLFVPYLMAGANGLENLAQEIHMLAECGADAIEIGIPFSDPVADGPTIQKAGLKALQKKVTLAKIIAALKEIHAPVPLIMMGYTNSFFRYGLEKFVEDIAQTDVKGMIIPDLPFEHRDLVKPVLDENDIALLQLISLTSSKKRITELLSVAEGFVYAVTLNGITGSKNDYEKKLDDHLAYITKQSSIPVLAGFGISQKEHVTRFKANCDGVVIGSKIVSTLENEGIAATRKIIYQIMQ